MSESLDTKAETKPNFTKEEWELIELRSQGESLRACARALGRSRSWVALRAGEARFEEKIGEISFTANLQERDNRIKILVEILRRQMAQPKVTGDPTSTVEAIRREMQEFRELAINLQGEQPGLIIQYPDGTRLTPAQQRALNLEEAKREILGRLDKIGRINAAGKNIDAKSEQAEAVKPTPGRSESEPVGDVQERGERIRTVWPEHDDEAEGMFLR